MANTNLTTEQWTQHNRIEGDWWGDCLNTSDEEGKHAHYARLMGLDEFNVYDQERAFGAKYDMRGKSVLDIGGGPVSLLLKCVNLGKAVIIDPCTWPQWVMDRYDAAGVEYRAEMAETCQLDEVFDEAWIYNTLQHVWQPEEVIKFALKHAKLIRVFEWINTDVTPGHPHILTTEFLDTCFGANGQVVDLQWRGYPALCYTLVLRTDGPEYPTFRFHLLGLAHVPTHREISCCAYTQKVVKLSSMLKSLGHTVHLYAGEGSEAECDELIEVVSDVDRIACYGNYDWRSEFFKHDGKDSAYQTFNANAIPAIRARQQPGDFLLCSMGTYQKPIADAFPDMRIVESGVGYRGVFAARRVFESYAWMHYIYGLTRQNDGSWYDAVIPNYFELDDFPFQAEKDGYALYIGRLVRRKGVNVAVQVTKELGIPLLMAGQGTLQNKVESLNITDDHVTFLGSVGPEERKKLYGDAKVTFVPTYYIEPFGGVAVESMLCGTPVICTDWGAMSETVVDGVTGYRCRTYDEFVKALSNIENIDPHACREWAEKNYSTERVRWQYQAYFEQVNDLHRKGWYELHDRGDRERYRRYYPTNGRV